MSTGMGDPSLTGMSQGNHAVSETMTEQILYWLSLDTEVRALAERLLQRFAVTVGDLPASTEHHHAKAGGLDRQSMKAALSLARQPRIDTLVSSETFPKQNFFGARRSFLATRWALGDRGPSSARSSGYHWASWDRAKKILW
jgi:Putative helicase